jgi:hypothetical protein
MEVELGYYILVLHWIRGGVNFGNGAELDWHAVECCQVLLELIFSGPGTG